MNCQEESASGSGKLSVGGMMDTTDRSRGAHDASEPGGANAEDASSRLFRLWITSYADWQPRRWNEAPPVALAIEPADSETHSALEAQCFLEGFNSQMLACDRGLWAVAIPVELRYEGDPQPGDRVRGFTFAAREA